ncbi:MAG: hypothetical protein Q7U52_09930 [Hydrogenophaga sp.]|uniref:hypothetical protein n=1 Tax=Hydrogenophaga sp. TaxID=1904254 RepID=UPI002722D284|nr:hypothetical protein [Hydrogenophaga sp.]MDO9147967.1 hypothetical protein [Hydrogenophaga sp.]MDO9604323.1 hypothetical protein [Hydrogenophaga sp.]MDP2165762.1 hypothetical protein [Hydrogenophaga sp.]MDP3474590.1 hypothetical protein [Hydrogenophaga sp.]
MKRLKIGTPWNALLCLLLVPAAWGQQPTAKAPPLACAEASAMTPAHLYGTWTLTLWRPEGSESAPLSTGTLRFERHPDYPGSVRGHLQRTAAGGSVPALVSGDVIDGEFNLDESADGIAIDAVWAGVPQDCGQTLRGTRRPAERPGQALEPLQFLLRKSPGWH